MERLAAENLPPGFGYEWTDIAFQEKQAGNTIVYLFPLAVLFVFLALSAQYESWLLPLAIILIVPLCLLFAILGVWLRGMDNNILTQIGFIVLIALASKNAILIVEFAKAEEDAGKDRFQAAIDACRLRLRPILMTAFSFILGVVPLLIATGAGFEMRRALGTAVFSGMLGVTLFGLFLTPVFYVVLRGIRQRPTPSAAQATTTTAASETQDEPKERQGPSADYSASSSDFERIYADRPPWDIGEPQPAFVDIADEIEGSVARQQCRRCGFPGATPAECATEGSRARTPR
jgi:hypothetical protein